MLLTESAATKKWCPYAMVAATTDHGAEPLPYPAHNRAQSSDGKKITGWGSPSAAVCMGQRCMAWRWAGWVTTLNTIASFPEPEDRLGERLGYCGLAGKPEGRGSAA